jgi:RNA recognition motif-containing protein
VSRGYGFVCFKNSASTDLAVEAVTKSTETVLDSPEVVVEKFVPKD